MSTTLRAIGVYCHLITCHVTIKKQNSTDTDSTTEQHNLESPIAQRCKLKLYSFADKAALNPNP
jgi:hypothetical protein